MQYDNAVSYCTHAYLYYNIAISGCECACNEVVNAI